MSTDLLIRSGGLFPTPFMCDLCSNRLVYIYGYIIYVYIICICKRMFKTDGPKCNAKQEHDNQNIIGKIPLDPARLSP